MPDNFAENMLPRLGQDSAGVQSMEGAPPNIVASVVITNAAVTDGMGIVNDDSIADASEISDSPFQIEDGAQELWVYTDATDLLVALGDDPGLATVPQIPISASVLTKIPFDLTAENPNVADGSRVYLSGGTAATVIRLIAFRRAV